MKMGKKKKGNLLWFAIFTIGAIIFGLLAFWYIYSYIQYSVYLGVTDSLWDTLGGISIFSTLGVYTLIWGIVDLVICILCIVFALKFKPAKVFK